MNRIVLFGDESISQSCLPVLSELNIVPTLVFDPGRPAATEFFNSISSDYEVIPHPDKSQRAEFINSIRISRVQFGLIVSYSKILSPELIDAFPFGVANIHGGRLPQYRGANILQWAIINGEKESAVTLHYIDAGIDSGPIITQVPIPLSDKDTAFTLRTKSLQVIPGILQDYLPAMLQGKVFARAQDTSLATSWPRRKPDDGGIDWSWSNEKIHNLTRALVPPWPPAFYFDCNGLKHEINRVLSTDEIIKLRKELGK